LDDSIRRSACSILLNECERALLRERQREDIELAKKRGAYRGRQRMVTDEPIDTIRARVAAAVPKAKLVRDLKRNPDSVYNPI